METIKILLLDDQINYINDIKEMLKSDGDNETTPDNSEDDISKNKTIYDVIGECSNAQEAIDFIRNNQENTPDILIFDIDLYKNNTGGIEAIRDINALNVDIPVIFLSRHDEDFVKEKCIEHGITYNKLIDKTSIFPFDKNDPNCLFQIKNLKNEIISAVESSYNFIDEYHYIFKEYEKRIDDDSEHTYKGFGRIIDIRNISYVERGQTPKEKELNNSHSIIYLKNSKESITVRKRINKIFRSLKGHSFFVRINSNYFINLFCVTEYHYKKQEVTVKIVNENKKLKIGTNYMPLSISKRFRSIN